MLERILTRVWLTHGPPYARVRVREGVFGDSYCSHTVKRHHCVPFQMKTPGASEPRYAPPFSRCEGDEERRLSVRPPERYKPPCNSHPHRSVSSGQYRQNLSSPPFNRAALERSSIWIWIWTGPWHRPHSRTNGILNSLEDSQSPMLHACGDRLQVPCFVTHGPSLSVCCPYKIYI